MSTPAAGVLGYTTSTSAPWSWHADPACPGMLDLDGRARTTLHSGSILEMAWAQAGRGLSPCPRCTLHVICDDLAERAGEVGYHALVCSFPGHAMFACNQCSALAAYGASRGQLVTRAGGRVAILRHGAVRLPVGALSSWRLGVCSTEDGDLPAITAPMWDSAAGILNDNTTLGAVLAAAVALYADPADGSGP